MNSFAHFIFSFVNPLFLKSFAQGAATECYAAVHPDATKHSGQYLADSNPIAPRIDAEDADLAQKLWEKTEDIIANLK